MRIKKSDIVLQIDDFLEDPGQVRNRALQCSYQLGVSSFPGFVTNRNILIPEFKIKLRELLPRLNTQGGPPPRLSHERGRFQYYSNAARRKQYIHTDYPHRWTALLFLGPHSGEFPGTSFYQHKATGLKQMPYASPEWRLRHLVRKDSKELQDLLQANRDRFKYHLWRKTFTVNGKFNRLVIFRSDYFHMADSIWGANARSGRLTFLSTLS